MNIQGIALKLPRVMADPRISDRFLLAVSAKSKKAGNFPAAKPFLNWAGGKAPLIPQFKDLLPLPREYDGYYEGCLGAGALFFYLEGTGALKGKRIDLNEKNPDIANLWRQMQNNALEVSRVISSEFYSVSETRYYQVRDQFNNPRTTDPVLRAAMAFYLNRTSFNGLFRYKKNGDYDTPFGKKSPNLKIIRDGELREKEFLAAQRALERVTITCDDFSSVKTTVGPGTFAYFDPPYFTLDGFDRYTTEGFSLADFSRMADFCHHLGEQGARWMVSNSFYPIIGQTMGSSVPAVVYSMDNINRGQDGASGKYIRPEWIFRNFHTRTEEPYIKEVETVRKLYDLVLRAQNEGLDIVSLFQTEWGGTRWHESLRLRAEGVDGTERAIEEFRDFNKPKEKRRPKARGRIECQLELF